MSGGDNPSTDTLIAHRFRIESLLGRGGTGSAYRVRDETNGGCFALKLLDVPEDPKRAQHLIDQFERE